MKHGGQFGCVTRTSLIDFASDPDPDLAYEWDTERELFSLAEVHASTECR